MNQPGEIIYKGVSKKGKVFLIRYIKKGDAPLMTKYINKLSKEETFVSFQGEEMKLDDEEKFVEKQIEKIKSNLSVDLLVFSEDQLIGISNVHLHERKSTAHEGVFGISVDKDYRDEGIGGVLLDVTLSEAEKNLKGLKIVTLGVFENNPLAISMYERRGFKESGRIPKGLFHRGKYVDHIFMYKFVNEFKDFNS